MKLTAKQVKQLKKITNDIKKMEKLIKNLKGENIADELPQLLAALSMIAFLEHEKDNLTGIYPNCSLPAFIKKD